MDDPRSTRFRISIETGLACSLGLARNGHGTPWAYILYAQPNARRDDRDISSLLLSMPSYGTLDAGYIQKDGADPHAQSTVSAGQ